MRPLWLLAGTAFAARENSRTDDGSAGGLVLPGPRSGQQASRNPVVAKCWKYIGRMPFICYHAMGKAEFARAAAAWSVNLVSRKYPELASSDIKMSFTSSSPPKHHELMTS